SQALDVWVLVCNLFLELREGRGHLVGFEVEHQPLGLFQAEKAVLDGRLRLEREPRVVGRRPDAAREDLRVRVAYAEKRKDESQAPPASVCAAAWARRASPSKRSWRSRSGCGSRPAARSGHSTTHIAAALKYSRKPACSHSKLFFSR